jgi:hypothetical protein
MWSMMLAMAAMVGHGMCDQFCDLRSMFLISIKIDENIDDTTKNIRCVVTIITSEGKRGSWDCVIRGEYF